jgi:hypothetical protein
MGQILRDRITYTNSLWQMGVWGKWIATIWGAYGIFAAIRDELWPDADRGRLRVLNLIPHLSAAWWTTVSAPVRPGSLMARG